MEKPMKVMLAEEGSEYGQTCANVLRSYGYEVTLVPKDGSEVISRLPIHTPDVLLMDEPTSALDPASTMRIEELMASLKESYTVVIVTHNMQQAARISDKCAFFLVGDLIEFGETEQVFSMPKDKRTEDYITGRFG